MKKITTFILGVLLLFGITASAEKWELAGTIGANEKVWIDADGIVPVKLSTDGTLLENVYRVQTKADGDDTIYTSIIDLKLGCAYSFENTKTSNWKSPTIGHNALIDYAYIYKNKEMIDKRAPYVLSEAEKNMPTTSFFVDRKGWRSSFENDDFGKGTIYLKSIQLAQSKDSEYPAIRFWATLTPPKRMNIKNFSQIRMLVEVNPNQPQVYTILSQKIFSTKTKKWETVTNSVGSTKNLGFFDPIAYLATTSYEYVLTHREEVEARGFFTFDAPVDSKVLNMSFE